MITDYCPIHGPLIITMRSRVSAAALHNSEHHLLIAKAPTMPTDFRIVTPLPEAIRLLEKTARMLKQTNPHGQQTVLTGIPSEQLQKLDVVMALIEQKQRTIDNDTIEERAELDKQDALARIARMQPITRKARQGKLDAETVMKAIRSEPDQHLAMNTLRHLVLRTNDLSVSDVDVITEDSSSAFGIDFNASKTYSVQMSVNAIHAESGNVSCVLQGGENLEPVFQTSDLGRRGLQFQVTSDKFILLGYCMLLGLHVKAQIAIRVSLTSKGPSYKCSLISFVEDEALLSSIRNGIAQQTPSLFA